MTYVTNYSTTAITNVEGKVYQRKIIEETHPNGFSWIAFTLIALVVLFFYSRFLYRLGFKSGKYQETLDRFNNGA